MAQSIQTFEEKNISFLFHYTQLGIATIMISRGT